jgi:signal peptidase I
MREPGIILSFILFVALFAACSPKPVVVEGSAMLPTFKNGDRILTDENIGELKRGDVITFLYPKDTSKWYLKRVVGLPGETVEIRSGKVYINGRVLDEPYLDESYDKAKSSIPPRPVPENSYFVIGDNRDNSSDSRYWGSVPRELVKGKYYMIYSKAKE